MGRTLVHKRQSVWVCIRAARGAGGLKRLSSWLAPSARYAIGIPANGIPQAFYPFCTYLSDCVCLQVAMWRNVLTGEVIKYDNRTTKHSVEFGELPENVRHMYRSMCS